MAGESLVMTEIDETSSPEEIVAWALRRFADRELVLSTSFGMEGCALIDMVARHDVPVRVIWLDTMFLFPETYALRDRMIARYPHLRFENRGTTLTPEAQAERYGPELWRRDPDRCCALRKVEPMRAALAGVDVWVTGIMRSQSQPAVGAPGRGMGLELPGLLKVSPLAGWDRTRVWDYVRTNEVPYNELHERGYPTLGLHPLHRAGARAPARRSTRGAAAGRARTRRSAGCTSTPPDTSSESDAAMTGQPESKVEVAKRRGRHLRGTIADTLGSERTHFGHDDVPLLKFHGTYQQDDRDARADARGGRARRRPTRSWSASPSRRAR